MGAIMALAALILVLGLYVAIGAAAVLAYTSPLARNHRRAKRLLREYPPIPTGMVEYTSPSTQDPFHLSPTTGRPGTPWDRAGDNPAPVTSPKVEVDEPEAGA